MRHQLTLNADKFQFHLGDAGRGWCPGMPELWTQTCIDDMLAVREGLVAIGTARCKNIPVTVEILPEKPPKELEQRYFDSADHVTTCHLSVQSGQIQVHVPGDHDNVLTLHVPPAIYRIVTYYNGLHKPQREATTGTDAYHVLIYPHTWLIEPRVLKRWEQLPV